jgi:hypothetical protein
VTKGGGCDQRWWLESDQRWRLESTRHGLLDESHKTSQPPELQKIEKHGQFSRYFFLTRAARRIFGSTRVFGRIPAIPDLWLSGRLPNVRKNPFQPPISPELYQYDYYV